MKKIIRLTLAIALMVSATAASAQKFGRVDLAAIVTKLFDNSAVTLDVFLLEINKELTTVANHFKQSATAVVVFVVLFEMLVEVLDSGCKDSDLNFGRSGVLLVNLVSLNDLLLFVLH